MASPRVLEPDPLLLPISEGAPTGENLREDPSPTSAYYQVKDARNAARTAERSALQAADPASAPSADWRPVLELAPQLLAQRSKDLEIAAWLLESLVRKHGFPGLRDGFELVRRMVETFWDGLYPLPDEEGMETRVAPLAGLNGDDTDGTLIVPIRMIPLVDDEDAELSTWHYAAARELATVTDAEVLQRRIDNGAATMAMFARGVSTSDPAELFSVLDDVEAGKQEFEALSSAVDERCGSASPPASNIRNALEDVLDCMRFLTKDLTRPSEEGEGEGADESGEGAEGGNAAASGPPGQVRTRQDAIEAIRRVRDFFRQTEPHSPISYVLDQSIRWAQMPLHVLVGELIPDSSALSAFQIRTGIPDAQSPSSESGD